MHIHNATIFGHDATDLMIEDGRIAAFGSFPSAAMPHIDATGLILAPGFVDLQLNGAFGFDFTADPTTIWRVAEDLPCYGVTSFLPTIITSPLETIAQAQAVVLAGGPDGWCGARPLGLHLEGPFLNPQRKGAHNPHHLRAPNFNAIQTWSPHQAVRLVTLAPELHGALEIICELSQRGVVVSLGHSMASFAETQAAVAVGARSVTHLFNAQPALHHREPGLIGAALDSEALTLGLIADGVHVHPSLVELVWRSAGSQRLALVTDAMAALGMPDGTFWLGDHAVHVADGVARLDNGTLAGSVLALDQAVRNLMAWTGCDLMAALPTVTRIPAALLHEPFLGRIALDAPADLVLLTPHAEVVMTICGGEIAYTNEELYAQFTSLP